MSRPTLALMFLLGSLGCGGAHTGPAPAAADPTPPVRQYALSRVRMGNVILTTDAGSEEALAAAASLQRTHDAFAQRLFPCARGTRISPAHVFAVEHAEDLEVISGVDWTGGMYIRSPMSWLPDQILTHIPSDGTPSRTYRHELAHRFLAICYPRLPRWLNEGLAGLYESAFVAESGRVVLGAASFLYSNNGEFGFSRRGEVVFAVLPRDLLPSITELRGMDRDDFYAERYEGDQAIRLRQEHYGGAWGAAHMLVLGDERVRTAFSRYLSQLSSSPDPEPEIWDRAFAGVMVNHLLMRYRQRETIVSRPVGPPLTDTHHPDLVHLDGFDTNVAWAEITLAAGNLTRAEARLAQAERIRAGDARVAMLRASLDALRDQETVMPLLSRAIEADPDLIAARQARLALSPAADYPEAASDIARIERSARSASELTALAEAHARRAEWRPALRFANRAIRLDRARWRAWRARARALMALAHPPESASAYRRAIATIAHSQHALRAQLEDELREVSAPPSGASGNAESDAEFIDP